MFIRTPYNYERAGVSFLTGVDCSGDKGRTQQSQKEEADINTIVRRFGLTGQMPVGVVPPTYQMFTDVFDYQSAQQAIIDARDSFMKIPADVRRRFNDSPQEFVEYCSDSKNLDEMRKMGLAVPAPVAPVVPA